MLGTRYEKYYNFKSNLPFVYYRNLYRTKASCGHEANWHENLEIQLCESGRGYVILDGEKKDFEAGDIVAVNSHVIHYTGTDEELTYSCIIIDLDYCKRADIDYSKIWFSSFIKSQKIREIFKKLSDAIDDKNDNSYTANCQRLILELLIELKRNFSDGEVEQHQKSKYFKTVRETIIHIQQNFSQKLILDEIAKSVLTDKFVLSREFKKATGQTIFEYINSFRCTKAAEMISNGTSVSEAARMSGFNNMSFFTRTFKRYMGGMPSDYKK